jgi:hypothetical protein
VQFSLARVVRLSSSASILSVENSRFGLNPVDRRLLTQSFRLVGDFEKERAR